MIFGNDVDCELLTLLFFKIHVSYFLQSYQSTYDTIIKDLHTLEDAVPRTREDTVAAPFPSGAASQDFDVLMAHLAGQLSHFLMARKKMIALYPYILQT
jgi:hypothetical protein